MSLTFKLTDSPPQPSLSVEQLNTCLVQMRKIVKISKLFTFRDLRKYVKRLQQKLDRTKDRTKIERKLNHRSEELQILRRLSVVRLCKLLLANDITKAELSKNGHKYTTQDRLVVRLASTKPVATFVTEFRDRHPDWRSLVHYLLYKNVSGKFKSREQKRRNRTIHGNLPLPPAPSSDMLPDGPSTSETWQIPTTKVEPQTSGEENSYPEEIYPASVPLDLDIDSDAASEIADEVVNQVFRESSRPKTGHMKASSEQSVGRGPPKKNVIDKKPPHGPQNDSIPHQSKKVKQLESVDSHSDEDNPLGKDDIEVGKKLKSKGTKQKSHTHPPTKLPFGKSSAKKLKKQRIPESELHPSWQAKRQEKMKARLVSVTPSTLSKHIVFDD